MENEILKLVKDSTDEINNSITIDDIEKLKIKYLGRKGILASYFEKLGTVPKEDKPKIGMLLNNTKKDIEARLNSKKETLNADKTSSKTDLTLPGFKFPSGKYHLLTKTMNEIKQIFRSLNFQIADGPEIETEYYNFEALNTPEHHPARDMQSTFYMKKPYLLRTQTSAVQVRYMEKEKPPVRIISIGKCYRSDPLDASHSPMFHQVEGLLVDDNVNFGDLKGVLTAFFSEFFRKDVTIRFTPSYFPFTEPSVEVAFSCVNCGGKGCNVCKNSGWLEVFGAGMVDPNVFKYVKYDAEKWTGFAFGGGVERLAMIKYNINDIRYFYENDIKFLEQF